MGIAGETGAIAPGLLADLALLDEDFTVLATVVGGEVVFETGAVSGRAAGRKGLGAI
jgi:adenine deaminase